MKNANIPRFILEKLKKIEPDAEFTGRMPKVQSTLTGKAFFAKIGSSSEKEQYIGEVESLKAIETGAPGLAPCVLSFGLTDGDQPYMISEFKDLSPITERAGEVLGKRLATELHTCKSSKGFGFEVATFCGATRLKNGWFDSWEKCYSAMISDLLGQLAKEKSYGDLCTKGEELRRNVIPKLLGPLIVQPVLLHGDLWSGNVGIERATNQPIIFDPSSYFGHNEADLAIARIFGGFPESFFATYHAHYPKAEPVSQYSLRGDLYELFHYLNHTLLFGGHYARNARTKMEKLIEAESEKKF